MSLKVGFNNIDQSNSFRNYISIHYNFSIIFSLISPRIESWDGRRCDMEEKDTIQ